MVKGEQRQPASSEVREAVGRVLQEHLAVYGLEEATVETGWDHDGDPALFVDAYFRLSETPVDPQTVYPLTRYLREELATVGEERFPYIRYHFDENQKVAG